MPSRPGSPRKTRRATRLRRRPTFRECRCRAAARCRPVDAEKGRRNSPCRRGRRGVGHRRRACVLHARLSAGGARRGRSRPHDADDQQGRVPGPRGRLRGLPLRAGRQAVRRRTAHAHAFRQSLRSQHHAGRRDRHRPMDGRRLLPNDAPGRLQGRHPDVSGDALCLLHQGDARGLRRHLRLPDVGAAGEPEESPARVALSFQPARPADRLANALLQGGRVRARHEQVGAMEPRRLPGGRPRALRDVPHRHQQAGRLEDLAGVRRRHDPEPELVCALAHVEPRGGPGQLEHQGDHGPAAGRRFASGHGLWADGGGGLQQPAVPERCGRRSDGGLFEGAAAARFGTAADQQRAAGQPERDGTRPQDLREAMLHVPRRRRQGLSAPAIRRSPATSRSRCRRR